MTHAVGHASVLDLFSLRGRVALVTGGAGRYGRGISEGLAEAGASVIVASRDRERSEAFAEDLRSRGLQVDAVALDLGREPSLEEAWRSIEGQWGGVDVLVNNAVARSEPRFEAVTGRDWEETLRVNATGLFLICRLAGLHMCAKGRGSIVNVASIHGVVSADFGVYGSTGLTSPANYAFEKGGMIQLTRYLAVKLAPHNVRVNSVSPGGLYSPSMPEEFVRNYCTRTPMGRMATLSDIKGTVVFLASDASAYVTGQNIVVDGGYTVV